MIVFFSAALLRRDLVCRGAALALSAIVAATIHLWH